MHPVEEYQNYNLDRGWVEWVQLWHPQEEGGVELLYNSVKTGSQLVWRPDPLVTRCGRESQHPRPPVEQHRRTGKKRGYGPLSGVNILQFCSVSNSLSHATFQIKWEVYFSKNFVAHLYYVVVCLARTKYNAI